MPPRSEPTTIPEQIADLYETVRRLGAQINGPVDAVSGLRGPQGIEGRDGRDGRNGTNGTNGLPGPAATVTIEDEGVSLGTFESIDFAGPGVAAALVGTAATVTITGGSVIEDPRYRMRVAV